MQGFLLVKPEGYQAKVGDLMPKDQYTQLGKKEGAKARGLEAAAEGNFHSATLWAGQWWQYQVKAADIGLRAKTYFEQHGSKTVQQ
jgi:nitrous-oxide reductase